MVTNSVFITAVVSLVVLSVTLMTLVVKVLGDRITEVAGRVGGLEGRMDTRMNALEGAARDVGERLTALEVGLGKR